MLKVKKKSRKLRHCKLNDLIFDLIPVEAIKSFVTSLSVCLAIVTVALILTCRTSDSGLLSNYNSKFAPGSLDATKNRIISILVGIFVITIVMCGFLDNRIHKKQSASLLDKLEKDSNSKTTVPTGDEG